MVEGVNSMTLSKLFRKIIDVLVYGMISLLLSFLISLLLTKLFGIKIYDSMTIIGLLIVTIGALASVGGNPSGVGINSIGQLNSQYSSNLNIEVTKMERSLTKYFESTANHTKLYFSSSKLNIILNGLFVIFLSIIISIYA